MGTVWMSYGYGMNVLWMAYGQVLVMAVMDPYLPYPNTCHTAPLTCYLADAMVIFINVSKALIPCKHRSLRRLQQGTQVSRGKCYR
jgi:hypothetical protein